MGVRQTSRAKENQFDRARAPKNVKMTSSEEFGDLAWKERIKFLSS